MFLLLNCRSTPIIFSNFIHILTYRSECSNSTLNFLAAQVSLFSPPKFNLSRRPSLTFIAARVSPFLPPKSHFSRRPNLTFIATRVSPFSPPESHLSCRKSLTFLAALQDKELHVVVHGDADFAPLQHGQTFLHLGHHPSLCGRCVNPNYLLNIINNIRSGHKVSVESVIRDFNGMLGYFL